METTEKRISDELNALARAAMLDSASGLDPVAVLDWAKKHRGSALHKDLFVDRSDRDMAYEARLARIRRYIKVTVQIVPVLSKPKECSVRTSKAGDVYSVMSLRGSGSYVPRAVADDRYRDDVINDGVHLLERFVRTYAHMSEFADIADSISAWLGRRDEDAA